MNVLLHLLVVLVGAILVPGISSVRYDLTEVEENLTLYRYNLDLTSFEELLRAEVEEANDGSDLNTFEGIVEVANRLKKLCIDDDCKRATKTFSSVLPKIVINCKAYSYWVLKSLYLLAHRNEQLADNARVKWAIEEAIRRHGHFCRPKYMEEYQSASKWFFEAKEAVDKVISSHDLAKIFSGVDGIRVPDVLERTLTVMGEQWKQKAKSNERRFCKKSLLDPCEDYDLYGANIFLPARVDLILDDAKISEIKPNEEFMDAWLKFRVCSAIYNDQSHRVRKLLNVAKDDKFLDIMDEKPMEEKRVSFFRKLAGGCLQ